MRLSIAIAAACIAAAQPAHAEDPGSTLLHLGTRIFDVGVEADRLRGHPENEGETRRFIPVFDSPWLFEMRKTDPALYNVVFHIELLNQDVGFVLDYERFARGDYQQVTGIPERFLLDGYEARGNRTIESVMYVPKDAPRDFAIVCAREHDQENRRWRDSFLICFVHAAYPPDPKILLLARIYAAEPFDEVSQRFDDIARRMREVAYCLDVTDEVAEGRWTPMPPEGLPGDLTGCAPAEIM
jgi:hypothetical protein